VSRPSPRLVQLCWRLRALSLEHGDLRGRPLTEVYEMLRDRGRWAHDYPSEPTAELLAMIERGLRGMRWVRTGARRQGRSRHASGFRGGARRDAGPRARAGARWLPGRAAVVEPLGRGRHRVALPAGGRVVSYERAQVGELIAGDVAFVVMRGSGWTRSGVVVSPLVHGAIGLRCDGRVLSVAERDVLLAKRLRARRTA
jgi:hypothetical protein